MAAKWRAATSEIFRSRARVCPCGLTARSHSVDKGARDTARGERCGGALCYPPSDRVQAKSTRGAGPMRGHRLSVSHGRGNRNMTRINWSNLTATRILSNRAVAGRKIRQAAKDQTEDTA